MHVLFLSVDPPQAWSDGDHHGNDCRLQKEQPFVCEQQEQFSAFC
jgi:hypothetical protein